MIRVRTVKSHSVFSTAPMLEAVRANVAKYPWAAEIQTAIVEKAEPWMRLSDEELWGLMFGHTISRSWMVWSSGYCPACKEDVLMYDWEIDVFENPWKVRCPHCKELFPKNDFHKFYCSGLDEHGVFDPKRADRSLLFNLVHADSKDPLHKFGVDDGEGYVEGDKRWRFIGAYLAFGQWKQAVWSGIRNLGAAHVVTGNPVYAHKAGVLLDRVADLYPTFDFEKEGYAYEKLDGPGYVSIWHDCCRETCQIALAWDQVREALKDDQAIVAFLSHKAKQFRIPNPKASFGDIHRNIEERILIDALNHPEKLTCNYPNTQVTLVILRTVLGWPQNRDEVYALLDEILEKATAVDGVTGEKGLTNYSAHLPQGLSEPLAYYSRLDPNFLARLVKRYPRLYQMYHFFIDTWCLQKYYPLVGDCGAFAQQVDQYAAVRFLKKPETKLLLAIFHWHPNASMYSFLWELYQLTGDATFVQALYRANGNSVEGLPYDLFAEDPEVFQRKVQEVIASEGPEIRVGSIDKQEWHLAVLRSGRGADERAVWVQYDSGGGHAHANGMNLGLFAKGLDLMPDFGYPPLAFGGWGTPEMQWYRSAAAHNTVAVDGPFHSSSGNHGDYDGRLVAGRTTLWGNGERFRAIRVSGPEIIGGRQFERTIVMVDISERDFYILDIFRVVGGKDHAKFMHSHYGQSTTQRLSLRPVEEYGQGTFMRNFRGDPAPQPGWSADWRIDDRHHYLAPESEIHLRYTDLTLNAQASICEGWIYASPTATGTATGYYEPAREVSWIPRIMVRRQTKEAPLATTFVGVIEPYEKASNIAQIRRLSLETEEGSVYPEADVVVQVQFPDGRCDLIVSADVENPLGLTPSRDQNKVLVQKEWGLRTDGGLCMIRRNAAGKIEQVGLCEATFLAMGDTAVTLTKRTDFVEVGLHGDRPTIVGGELESVKQIVLKAE